MPTQCNLEGFDCQPHGSRSVRADFSAGHVSSDAGGLLLREVDLATGLIARLATCFTDSRNQEYVEFGVDELLRQRIYGLVLGYEDVNDHDRLRVDPLLAMAVGRQDVEGLERREQRDRGAGMSGKSTLNRLERSADVASANPRYHKIAPDFAKMDQLLVEVALRQQTGRPRRIVLDIDASDVQLHGQQQGRFFHGYYGNYCYLPLYTFWDEMPVGVRLRRANMDAAAGSVDEVAPIVRMLRKRWPGVQVILRGDSGFCRDEILTWCERNAVNYVFGLARNSRLEEKAASLLDRVRTRAATQENKTARDFMEFRYRTIDSWARSRRVIAKAEVIGDKDNPRFIVTNLRRSTHRARHLYEEFYCARGEAENHIKEQQLELFGTRASNSTMPSNQLRMYLSAFAHILSVLLRRHGLRGTQLAEASPNTVRTRLLKVGAVVKVSVRRVLVSMAASFPMAATFAEAIAQIRTHPPPRLA